MTIKVEKQIEIQKDTLFLTLSTRKSGDNIKTYASVSVLDRNGYLMHGMNTDFNKLIKVTTCKRVTQRLITEQADAINVPEVIKEALEFYKNKELSGESNGN